MSGASRRVTTWPFYAAAFVVLADGTRENARLLLNSNLANSSGMVGRYLMDRIYGAGIVCSVPEVRNGKSKGIMGNYAIVPRFRNIDKKADKFLRGYAFNMTASQGSVGARNFNASSMSTAAAAST